MYRVTVERRFSATHRVRIGSGELEPVHAHEWVVEAAVVGEKLDADGLLVDFCAMEATLEGLLRDLEGADLNAAEAMRGLNPSAEHVARVIADALAASEPFAGRLESVRVTEAPGCTACYFPPTA